MKITPTLDKARTSLAGFLVADAAGMGIHWIYSQGKIKSVAQDNGGNLEFLHPDPKNYEGVPSFFAHPLKSAGDGTNYSEYIPVLLKAIEDGEFSVGAYLRAFGEHFGVGGTYVGYADGPMRETIYNMTHLGKTLVTRCMASPIDLDQEKKSSAAHYIARYFFEHDTQGLKEAVRVPLKLQQMTAEELAKVDALVDEVSQDVGALGPDDDQMPALTRSAVLAALYSGDTLEKMVDTAVRMTNNNDKAVAYSVFFAKVLEDLYNQPKPKADEAGTLFASLSKKHLGILPEESAKLVQEALDSPALDYRTMTKRFGAACHVDMAVPLGIHILIHTKSYTEAIKANNMASGDNGGRAVLVGTAAGVLYGLGGEAGIPDEWVKKTRMVDRLGILV